MQTHANRLIPLEAYRGIAAFIVLVHHFFLGFSPSTTGLLPSARVPDSFVGQPFFVFFNGTGAVGFFFTLSGFVLCWSYFKREDQRKLLIGFVKRLPRLAGIVTLTTVTSWALFKLDLYHFEAASKASGSPWLASFAYAGWTSTFRPSFVTAFAQGVTTFFTGEVQYNTNLWTMRHEFFGSMIVYMLAPFIAVGLGYRYRLYVAIVLSLSAGYYSQYLFPFIAGAFLSSLLARKEVALSKATSVVLIAVGLYVLGYIIPEKSYRWVAFVLPVSAGAREVCMHTLGALAIIFGTMANRQVFEALNGRFFRLIGQLSFPLYLIHTLVICSLSSWVYLLMTSSSFNVFAVLLVTFVVTALASMIAAVLLWRIDDWWVFRVNSVVQKLVQAQVLDLNAATSGAAGAYRPLER